MAGNAAPDIVKPAPITVAPLIVTGATPVEVKTTDCVADVLITTSPKATLVALTLSVGTAAPSCKMKVSDTPLAVAVSVTIWAVMTEDAVAVNPTLVPPAGTATAVGTVIALLLLAKLTVRPSLPAAAFKVTVHASAVDPSKALLVQLNELNDVVLAVPLAEPVPLRLITIVPLLVASLAIIS